MIWKKIIIPSNNFLIGCAIEHVWGKKNSVKLLQKINLVRNHEGVMLLFELIGTNGRCLTHCRRVVEERNSMLWKGRKTQSKKPDEGSRKVWE